jgi:hypothetical protein
MKLKPLAHADGTATLDTAAAIMPMRRPLHELVDWSLQGLFERRP